MITAPLSGSLKEIPRGSEVLIEGEEETTGHIEEFVTAHPEFFRCDVFIIVDNGNLSVGDPALVTALRGEVSCIINVHTSIMRCTPEYLGERHPMRLLP